VNVRLSELFRSVATEQRSILTLATEHKITGTITLDPDLLERLASGAEDLERRLLRVETAVGMAQYHEAHAVPTDACVEQPVTVERVERKEP